MNHSAPVPDDIVNGGDPAFKLTAVRLPGRRCTCGYTDTTERMQQHLWLAHPAARNPDLTCHVTPRWDYDRWCLRPKGHDGDHWTPSFNGGMSWPQHPDDQPFEAGRVF